jgi:outer membrane protein assembly factor BamB
MVVATTRDDGQVHALAVASGAPIWTAPHVADVETFGDIRYAVAAAGHVVAGSIASSSIIGYDRTTGAQIWRANPGSGGAGDPLYTDGTTVFVVHSGGPLTAINAATGQIQWRAGKPQPGSSGDFTYGVAVDSDRLYLPGFTAMYAIKK